MSFFMLNNRSGLLKECGNVGSEVSLWLEQDTLQIAELECQALAEEARYATFHLFKNASLPGLEVS